MLVRFRHLPPYRQLRIARVVAWALPRYLALMLRGALGLRVADAAWDSLHDRTAMRIETLASDLQGAIIKFAQIVGARPDVFPAGYVRRLKRFHDRVPPRTFEAFHAHLAAQFDVPLESIFAWIDPEPLAAASLAQVHRGRLHDGTDVAIKLQYPEVARVVPVDMRNLARVARIVQLLSGIDVKTLHREIARNVVLELDFAREARSTQRIAKDLADSEIVRVPRVYSAHSRDRVIVLEFLEGWRITDLEALERAGHDPSELMRRVARIYTAMIFEHDFFQADPHPGNLLVLPDGRIGLLDFGMCTELPKGFAADVARFGLAVLAGDREAVAIHSAKLGVEADGVEAEALHSLVAGMLDGFVEGQTPLDVLRQGAPIEQIPEGLPLILRSFVLLGGLAHTLVPRQPVLQLELLYGLVGAAGEEV